MRDEDIYTDPEVTKLQLLWFRYNPLSYWRRLRRSRLIVVEWLLCRLGFPNPMTDAEIRRCCKLQRSVTRNYGNLVCWGIGFIHPESGLHRWGLKQLASCPRLLNEDSAFAWFLPVLRRHARRHHKRKSMA